MLHFTDFDSPAKDGESACTGRPLRAAERIVNVHDMCGRVRLRARERGLRSSERDTARVYLVESGPLALVVVAEGMIRGRTR